MTDFLITIDIFKDDIEYSKYFLIKAINKEEAYNKIKKYLSNTVNIKEIQSISEEDKKVFFKYSIAYYLNI